MPLALTLALTNITARQVAENNPALGVNCIKPSTCDMKEQSIIETLHSKKFQLNGDITITNDSTTGVVGLLNALLEQAKHLLDQAANISLIEWNRNVSLAENKKPGLTHLQKPGCLYTTVQTTVLIETLIKLSADMKRAPGKRPRCRGPWSCR